MKTMTMVTLYALALSLTACDGNRIFRDGVDGKSVVGPAGPQGDPGSSCSTTPLPDASGALILCGDGTSVVVTNGAKGDTGNTGANGQDATPVVMLQLCPNVVSNFPEQAFVIGGKLYAVFSSGGNASLAVLTPGTYTTTAPGQNCSFTVQPDGVTVTH